MLETEDMVENPRVECVTRIRGREVTCWLENGRVAGDPELLDRLRRVAVRVDPLDEVALTQMVRDAVGSDVSLRFAEAPHSPSDSSIMPPAGSTRGGMID